MTDIPVAPSSEEKPSALKPPPKTLFYQFARLPLRMAADYFFDLKFKGLENIPAAGGAILACIHQSNLDPVMYALPVRRELHFLAKIELFETWWFGAILRGLHGFPVRRGEADLGAMKEAIRRIKEGEVMLIFPEGTRSETGAIKKLEPGIGLMARRTGAPLIPAVIHGTHDSWPKGAKFPRPYPVKILYGKPVDYSNLKPQEIIDRLEVAIRDLHKQILGVEMIVPISDPADPRIAQYTRMKERDLIHQGDLFVAESEQVVRRLIESGRHEILSILSFDRKADMMHALVEPLSIPVYSAPHALVNSVIGFKFHSGVMAVARRAKTGTLRELAASWADRPVLLMILPDITKTDNLGALVRIAAGFSADAMLIGPRSCDPYYRQSVRVSMGSVFKIPILRSEDLLADLEFLKNEAGVELVGMVADNKAGDLRQIAVGRRVGVLLGHETDGLSPEVTNLCSYLAAIKMNPQVDSFNVSVAGGSRCTISVLVGFNRKLFSL